MTKKEYDSFRAPLNASGGRSLARGQVWRSVTFTVVLAAVSAIAATPFAWAQQVVANGTNRTLAPNTVINTGTTGGNGGIGIRVLNNGTVTANGGGSIATGGGNAFGIGVGTAGSVSASGFTINTSGVGADGVNVIGQNSIAVLTGGSFSTTNDTANALDVSAGGSIVSTNAALSTAGAGSYGASADGAGSTISITGGTITTSGTPTAAITAGGYGLYATNAGAITASSLQISTTGQRGVGVVTFDAGTVITLQDGVTINTTGLSGYGLTANTASTINSTNTVITTQGQGGAGVATFDQGTTVNLTSGSITTSGPSARGIIAQTGSSVISTNLVLSTSGPSSYGIIAQTGSSVVSTNLVLSTSGTNGFGLASAGVGSRVAVTNGVVTTTGQGSNGYYALGGSSIEATDTRLSTSGLGANGGVVGGQGSTLSVTGGSVTTSGDGGNGLMAQNGGALTVQEGTLVTTSGNNAAAAQATGSGSRITLATVSLTTGGASAAGIAVSAGGAVSAQDTQIATRGADAAAIVATQPSGTTAPDQNVSTVAVSGGSVTSALSDTIRASGGLLNLTFAHVASSNGSGLFLNALDDAAGNHSIVNFQATDSALNGDIFAAVGNVANVSLVNSTLTGASTNATNISLNTASTWNVTGDSNATGSVTNAGLIQFLTRPGAYSTLAVGNFTGSPGSRIGFNTYLGADNSPSNLLVINGGQAGGTSSVLVNNTGGPGAQTVADGIRLVQVTGGGTTAAGAFTLGSRVTAGAYEYQLFRGGSTNANDWFLRSSLVTLSAPSDPTNPASPSLPSGPVIPLYRPEVALYAPIPAIGRQMGLTTLGTLHERVGEEENIRGLTGGGYANGGWARAIGERTRNRWDGTVDSSATANIIGLQAGFDILRTAPYADGHRDHAGVYVAYTDYNAPTVRGFALGVQNLAVGRLLMSGPSVGAYWTHFGPSGWYLDAVFQANWFDVKATSDFGTGLDTNGTGYTASLEAGYPIRFAPGWMVEPQAQIVYQNVSIDRTRDAFSSVDWDTDDAWTGRLGARVQYTAQTPEALWQPYAKVNLWHTFSGTDRVSFGGTPVANRFGNTALEVGAGITARVTQNLSFYGNADYRWSIDGDSRGTAVQGTIGIRFNW